MTRIPHAADVARALRAAQLAVKQAHKGVNRVAGKLMTKGDYAGAEALAARGREVAEFQAEVQALRKRWRELRGGGGGGKRGRTPLWAFYQPILKTLAEAGGEARRTEIERGVERLMQATLQPGDRVTSANGRERWRTAIRRARKHLATEGWIEDGARQIWKITSAGRRAAERPARQLRGGEE